MNLAERRVPQDGRAGFRWQGKDYQLRMNCLPVLRGKKLVARILDRSAVFLGLTGWASPPIPSTSWRRSSAGHRASVTGPTGAGKSTTLYSILNRLNDTRRHILTIEDPVEYELAGA